MLENVLLLYYVSGTERKTTSDMGGIPLEQQSQIPNSQIEQFIFFNLFLGACTTMSFTEITIAWGGELSQDVSATIATKISQEIRKIVRETD